jgi:segregation and condensation protein B
MTDDADGTTGTVTALRPDDGELLRVLEALLFAATEPLAPEQIKPLLPEGVDPEPLLERLRAAYAPRGVNLVLTGGRWSFRTAPDLGFLLRRETVEERRLSRAAIETLAIIAYHQPVTRTEIEEIRGVAIGRGSIDILIEAGWIEPKGRRRTPGKPLQYGTSAGFLDHFGLESLEDLPGLDELKSTGLLEPVPPAPQAGQQEESAEED